MVQAADIIGLSQPAVSRLVSDLEASIGYRLFDRRRGRLTPRDEARELYREVEFSFVGLSRIRESAERIGRRQTTDLRVAMLPALATGPLVAVVARFLDDHPEVFLSLASRTRMQILDGLAHNQHDIGLVGLPVNEPNVGVRQLATAESVCLVPADHPLSAATVITTADLDGENIIGNLDRSPLRRTIDRLFDDFGARPDIRVEVTTAQAAFALVAQGVGITLAWRDMFDLAAVPGVRVIPFRPQIDFDLAAVLPANRPLDGMAETFVDANADAAQAQQSVAPHTKER